jgi:hypothetical protein
MARSQSAYKFSRIMANTSADCPCSMAFAEYRTIPYAEPHSIFGGITSVIVSTLTFRSAGLAEVRVLQARIERKHAFGLLLDIDESKLAVVEQDHLDGQLLLHDRHELAQQHGETSIAGHRWTIHLSCMDCF